MPRQNPRRTAGAPVRLEDDESYLSGNQNRDSTKPPFPKLLAQSTAPYDPTLLPVAWNTKPLDQNCLQIRIPAHRTTVSLTSRGGLPDTREEQDFREQPVFGGCNDLNMASSESASEESVEDGARAINNQDLLPVNLNWSSLRPALQLSLYEYVYQFLENQYKNTNIELSNAEIEHTAAEMLDLSSLELIDIEAQRVFRTRKATTEAELRDRWLKDEEETYLRESRLSKGLSSSADDWQEINRRYIAQMVHITRYTYATKLEIETAKAYLEMRGLKSKVSGEWAEDQEGYAMVLVSTKHPEPQSPILLPGTCIARVSPVTQALPVAAISLKEPSNTRAEAYVRSSEVVDRKLSDTPLSPEVRTREEFARKHDPKIIPTSPSSTSWQEEQRGHLPIQPSDLMVKINDIGRAELRKKRTSNRREASQLPPNDPDKSSNGVRLVVEDGRVRVDMATKATPEVQELLRTGLKAGRRVNSGVRVDVDTKSTTKGILLQTELDTSGLPNATGMTSQFQDTKKMAAVENVHGRSFSKMQQKLYEIDSDHMPATESREAVAERTTGQLLPLNLKSIPPPPNCSPVASASLILSPSAGPSPSPAKVKLANKGNPSALSPKAVLLPVSVVASELQMQMVARNEAMGVDHLPFYTLERSFNAAEQGLSHSAAASRRASNVSSTLLVTHDDFTLDYDSGLGTSRGPSTEPEATKPPKPEPKQPDKKTGKGARGGRAAKTTRKKVAK